MPKIAKCLKCLKLRYSVDFNKNARSGIILFLKMKSGLIPYKIPHSASLAAAFCRGVAEGEDGSPALSDDDGSAFRISSNNSTIDLKYYKLYYDPIVD
jgi:hypothetical protein